MKTKLKTKEDTYIRNKNDVSIGKSTKGITLIALVITIIVLLILAGITIAMLTGQNGILTNAQSANMQSDYFQAEERVRLAYMSVKTEIMTQKATNSSYNAQSKSGELLTIVQNDLTGKEWTTGDSAGYPKVEGNAIKIRYSKASLKEGGISTTPKRPKQNSYVEYVITLKEQDATLSIDGVELNGEIGNIDSSGDLQKLESFFVGNDDDAIDDPDSIMYIASESGVDYNWYIIEYAGSFYRLSSSDGLVTVESVEAWDPEFEIVEVEQYYDRQC